MLRAPVDGPIPRKTTRARRFASWLLAPEELRRYERLRYRDAGYGYDVFGLHPDWVAAAAAVLAWPYRRYFRVVSHGVSNVPPRGPCILVANHSGTLPVDAMMLWLDLLRRGDPPRAPRVVADRFVPRLPFVSTLFARTGMISGARTNIDHLLDGGEQLVIFPEGTVGIGKPLRERYQIREWRVGHAELALRHRVPVVPVAIIGAEEQWPTLLKLQHLHPFGAPWLPVPATPLPLPVRYHLWYGEPIHLDERWGPADADDPAVVGAAADITRVAVCELIARGLDERVGVFA